MVAGAAKEPAVAPPQGPAPAKLVVETLRPGWGVEAREGDLLTTKFVAIKFDGDPFESTWDPGRGPFSFHLGAGEASPAWEKGLRGMKVGERRELLVPADIASRFGPLPAGDDFVYVVELIGVAPPELDDRHEPTVVVPPGRPPQTLRVRDVIPGSGPRAESGDLVTMRYVSRHYTGKPFSNSWDDGHPFRIQLGADTYKSIPGWRCPECGSEGGGKSSFLLT
jgi:peptidylprolyl isomerase